MINLEKLRNEKPLNELLEFSILNIDKPTGPTSFDVSDKIRRLISANKTGHFGTLDPAVTGVLPIALNKACKLTAYFMKKDKTYVGIMHLHKPLDEKPLRKELTEFIGPIMQLPPVRSRVKRQERERTIHSFEILEIKNQDVLFKVKCEAGTYIRKLIHDLGLKIEGAHMAELRRTDAGIFSENDKEFANIYELEKAMSELKSGNEQPLRKLLIPAEIISKIIPVVQIKKEAIIKLQQGSPLFPEMLESKQSTEEKFCVFHKETLIGIFYYVKEGNAIGKSEVILV